MVHSAATEIMTILQVKKKHTIRSRSQLLIILQIASKNSSTYGPICNFKYPLNTSVTDTLQTSNQSSCVP